jgi:hypothetical protein
VIFESLRMSSSSPPRQSTTTFFLNIQLYGIRAVKLARPYSAMVGFLCWTLHRMHSSTSLLTLLNDAMHWLRDQVRTALATAADNVRGGADEMMILTTKLLPWILEFVLIVMADVVAICGCLTLARIVYCLCNYSWQEWKTRLVDMVFEWSRRNVAVVRQQLEQQQAKVAAQSDAFFKKDPNRIIRRELPAVGQSADEVLCELRDCSTRENQCWRNGRLSGTVYAQEDPAHTDLMNAVYALYTWSNPLHPGCWPKINQCEAEVVLMVARLLHAPVTTAAGTMTSGGTESIILAVRASLSYYGHGIRYPENCVRLDRPRGSVQGVRNVWHSHGGH